MGHSGLDLLTLSFSHFDLRKTSADLAASPFQFTHLKLYDALP